MTTAHTPIGDAGVGVVGISSDAGGGLGPGVGVLALTGAGPGTLIFAIAGFTSVVVGAIAVLTGRTLSTRNTASDVLPDLSHRVTDLA